jgi:hypothetical protein
MLDADKPLSKSLQEQCGTARVRIQELYGGSLNDMTHFLDAQCELLRLTFWTTQSDEFSARGPAQAIVYSALHKNAFLFFSAIDLAGRGLYGPAATLLRPILEGLVCAKYCALAEDSVVLDTWRAGLSVSLRNHVLNRIDHPRTDEIGILWDGLNKLTHATKYAQQLTAEFECIKKEIHGILAIVGILLAFNYHLLTRHFLTPTAIYYVNSFDDKPRFQRARKQARSLAAVLRQSFGRDGKRFLRECCASWRLKASKHGQRRDPTATSSGRARP